MKKKGKMVNVVLCGGKGTRLWPISKENMPKQFLKIFGEQSLYQLTLLRNMRYSDKVVVVSNAEQYFISQDQTEELGVDCNSLFVVESIGRNTAASIAFSCFTVMEDSICFVTPSDHIIKDNEDYQQMVEDAKEAAKNGDIVVFGIEPHKPETGYGYIEAKKSNQRVVDVSSFKEKPNLQTAQYYLNENQNGESENEFFWNSGMFMFQAGVYLEELQKYAPDVYETAYATYQNSKKHAYVQLKTEDMQAIPDISVDYAVMEQSKKIKVVKTKIEWNDVGSFDSLDTILEKDANQNTKNDNIVAYHSKNNFVFGRYKTIALNGVEDLIVVDTPSALLVSKKGASQQIKELVKQIQQNDPDLVKFGRKVYRPWGNFTNLFMGDAFKVKTIIVKPGRRLSLQKHMHRSEHWVVVRGTALVTLDDKEFLLPPNESTYIPIGTKHRLENPGKLPLEVVEVQVGSYLEEDDIVRYSDDYGRTEERI